MITTRLHVLINNYNSIKANEVIYLEHVT